MSTIRKNAKKKIRAILEKAILIREWRYGNTDEANKVVDVDYVMEISKINFRDVYQIDGRTYCTMNSNWAFIAYESIEAAKRHLTPEAFAKYFPGA